MDHILLLLDCNQGPRLDFGLNEKLKLKTTD